MIEFLQDWYQRHFSDPQVVILALFLIIGFAIILLAGDIIAPVLAGIVIAYLLDGAVEFLRRGRLPRVVALLIVFLLFIAFLLLVTFGLAPILFQQVTEFFRELPNMISEGQLLLMQLPERYPHFISETQLQDLIAVIRAELALFGQKVVSLSLASVVGLITIMVYAILVPLLVFFFLKDKQQILNWSTGFLPKDRRLSMEVWAEVNSKIASYVRGKFTEILIVWSVTYITFVILGLNYAMLLSFMVGISVIIPYVGAAIVTIPVTFIAYFQWGLSSEFAYVVVAYGVIQFLDGNLLVPLLFSEVVNLHPVAIITAVLVFGGIWGVWGVFFAIPLATLIQAVINSWPSRKRRNKKISTKTLPSGEEESLSANRSAVE
ncbi:MAG: AI-2E family transporter [Gammaproteobacteria bacterium]|nr:AI-2E family transporter [Gammaproteobacteria bacterium]